MVIYWERILGNFEERVEPGVIPTFLPQVDVDDADIL